MPFDAPPHTSIRPARGKGSSGTVAGAQYMRSVWGRLPRMPAPNFPNRTLAIMDNLVFLRALAQGVANAPGGGS